MILESKTREQIRLSLLRLLDAAVRALDEDLLVQMIRADGFKIDKDTLRAELQYLADKAFLVKAAKAISPENPKWGITSAGRDFYAEIANG